MTWYNNSWNYRKAITISSVSALTGYQVSITVDTATLVVASKMRSDCNDIMFTSSDDSTLLNYWIESGYNTSSTKIWIKIPSISSGSNTIYLYYGNSGAAASSSGTNTFIFFEDFLGTSINGSVWSHISPYGGVTVSNSILSHTASLNKWSAWGATGVSKITPPLILETYAKYVLDQEFYIGVSDYDYAGDIWGYNRVVQGGYYSSRNANVNSASVTPSAIPTVYTRQTIKIGTSDVKFYLNGVLDATITTNIPTVAMGAWFAGTQAVYNLFIDWIIIRTYAATEPTLSTIGTEEPNATAHSMSLTQSETPCRTGICTVRADITWQNLGSSSITFRPKILIDGTTYVQAASDITIGAYPTTSSTIQITTPTLAVGTHSICPYPN